MDLSDLNPEQHTAVTHGSGPLMVVAGAGTGKTQVITRRIAYLIEQGKAAAAEIVALTFTDKAAAEMEERVDRLLPYGVVDTRILTFHSFGDSLIKEFALDIGLNNNLGLMSKTQQIVFLRDHFDRFKFKYYAPVGHPDKYLDALAGYFGRLKEELITPERYVKFATKLVDTASGEADQLEAARQLELAQAFQTYQSLGRSQGLIDFGDQIALAIELFERRPNVLNRVRQGIKYLLVDEFQDTNFAQSRLLELLAGPSGNITVVGDDDQSIYKFRGAAISNILNFRQRYQDVKEVVLVRNYRSSQQILDSCYRLIQHNNPDRLEAKYGISKRLTSDRSGPEPVAEVFASYGLEADGIAAAIKKRLNSGGRAGDIAVLIRKRNQAEAVTQALAAKSIPYHLSGSQNLYTQPEVEIMLYFLHYIVDPGRSVDLYHLLASDVYRVNLSRLMEAAAQARRRNLPLEELLRAAGSGDNDFDARAAAFLVQVERWRQLSTSYTVGQLAFDFLEHSGYLDRLTEQSRSDPRVELVLRNLNQFFGLLGEFERVAVDKSAMAYTLVAGALREAGENPEAIEVEGADLVQVMTIHKAKGLEFDSVYLFDLVAQTFPSIKRAESIILPDALVEGEVLPQGDWHTQEERRLMYVAMTRSKRHLVMTYSPDHGGKRPKKPSIFLTEALGQRPPTLDAADAPDPLEQIALFRQDSPTPSIGLPFASGDRLTLTPHQIDDYLSCPENFRYLYILQVPQPPQPALMYGSLVHNVIQRYHQWRRHGKVKLPDLLELCAQLWQSDNFLSKGQEERRRQLAEETIKRFWQREEATKRRPTYVEHDFRFELPDQKVIVKGRFDAVYVDPDGSIEIRDYKTSLVEDPEAADKKAKTNLQLAIYALAWQRLSGRLPDRVVLDYVDTGQLGAAVKSAADLEQTAADIGQVAAGIRAGDFMPGKQHFYCVHRPVGG